MCWRIRSVIILLGSEYYVANIFVLLLAGVPWLVLGPLDISSTGLTLFYKSIFSPMLPVIHVITQICSLLGVTKKSFTE